MAPLVVSSRTRKSRGASARSPRRAAPQKTAVASTVRMPEYYPPSGSFATAIAFPVHRLGRLMDLLPAPLVFGGGGLVVLTLFISRLGIEPLEIFQPVGIELPGLDRLPHRAARL